MQNIVALSVIESEIIVEFCCVKYMLHIMRILNGLRQLMKLPVTLRGDNSGSVDITNHWSSAGSNSQMNTTLYFLIYLKEEGIINNVWTHVKKNLSYLLTKNFPGQYFNKNMKRYCGDNSS